MPARLALALFLSVTLWVGPVNASTAWTWPVDGRRVTRAFDAPASEYGPGHRGIDLAGASGTLVRAVAPGTVRFAGTAAGRGVVVVDHGLEQSTYEPVAPQVTAGEAVAAGGLIGVLQPGHRECLAPACLHLGRKRGDSYLDPLEMLSTSGRFRLVSPEGPPPVPAGAGGFALPVSGPITSPYGWRIHPITRRKSFHDGIDFGAACGTDVHAAAPGTIVSVSSKGAYGLRVEVRHPDGSVSSYSHLSKADGRIGEGVATGELVGKVGSSGLATGCHLHFSVYRHGRPVDPSRLL
jgi:murein DD-endopeptidase MepM/ murein hydrolase activator NlpD